MYNQATLPPAPTNSLGNDALRSVGEIEDRLNVLEKCLAELDVECNLLAERITPILSPPGPEVPMKESPDRVTRTPMGNAIQSLVEKTAMIARGIRNVRMSVQL